MRLAIVRSGFVRTGQCLASRSGLTFLFGLIAGWYVVAWFHQLTAALGLSLTTVTAVAIATALGFELAWKQPRTNSSAGQAPIGSLALLCLVPAAWSIGFGWLMQQSYAAIAQLSIESLANPGTRLLISLAIAIVAIAIPVYALTRLPGHLTRLLSWHSSKSSSDTHFLLTTALFITGVAAGIMTDVLLLAPAFGLRAISFTAIFCTVGLIGLIWKQTRSTQPTVQQPPTEPETGAQHRIGSIADSIWNSSLVLCLGGLAAIAMRMTHQLSPTAGFLLWAEWATLMATVAAGLYVATRWTHRQIEQSRIEQKLTETTSIRSTACLLAAACCGTLPLFFAWHVSGLLWANSYVEPVWLQMLLRCLVVATMLGPIGFSWGMFAFPASSRNASPGVAARFPQFSLFSFVAGMLAVRWLLLPRWPVENVLPFIAVGLAAAAALQWAIARHLPQGRLARATVAALLALAALSPFVRHQYNPAHASRLLFSTQVFLAKRSGMQGSLLPFIDEGRLIAQREGEHGTYTIWKMRGAQLQVREGGIPKAIVSRDTQICPQFSADVMQAALPILLHENPRTALLLGLQGGVTLDTCFHFPLQQVTCVESDPELIRLVSDVILTSEKQNLFQDDRVKMLPLDPALAVVADDASYDIIISCPDQSALAQSTPYFTREFYRNAAGRLTDDGIFCQRLQYVDFGPEPLRIVTATMQQAFRTVTVVETASGELALLGTNSQLGLIRQGLMDRLQANHVRNVLGQVGWDWVMPLNLAAYGQQSLTEFVAESQPVANTTANGQFTFGLPREVMRWGAKQQEMYHALASRTKSFLKWGDNVKQADPAEDAPAEKPIFAKSPLETQSPPDTRWIDSNDEREALLRLEEIAGRHNIIARYPDRKWAYRKTLRERMKTKSRSIIEPGTGGELERVLHPDDRRRQQYLAVLGKAVKDPNADSIRRISDFSQPYDPLVSFFLHDEIARLYDRSQEVDPEDELRHRLHLVYYTDARDQSVRNIVAAINLLSKHPAAVSNPVERRDHLDALLQMLKSRWQGRGAGVHIPKDVALNDVAESVSAMTSAFDAMEHIYADSKLDAEEWQARRKVLERTIVRPLRTYRTQLLSQRVKRKQLSKDQTANAN